MVLNENNTGRIESMMGKKDVSAINIEGNILRDVNRIRLFELKNLFYIAAAIIGYGKYPQLEF